MSSRNHERKSGKLSLHVVKEFPGRTRLPAMCLLLCAIGMWGAGLLAAQDGLAPVPLLTSGQPVNWWFVFKFNTQTYPDCGGAQRTCLFGGTVQPYKSFGQQFAFASSADGTLRQGFGCVGDNGRRSAGRYL